LLSTVACMRTPNPNVEFAQHAWSAHRGVMGEPVETIYYDDDAGRPRYRTYGIFRNQDDGRWGVTWADYGRVSQYRYEATLFPTYPQSMHGTREEALQAAERAAIDFRFEVGVHTDPIGAPNRVATSPR
jgi:hypothetical protein